MVVVPWYNTDVKNTKNEGPHCLIPNILAFTTSIYIPSHLYPNLVKFFSSYLVSITFSIIFFFYVLWTALITFSNFTKGTSTCFIISIDLCYIGGVLVDDINCLGSIPHYAINHGGGCKNFHCNHPVGGCHVTFFGKSTEWKMFGAWVVLILSRVYNNFLFLPIFVANEPTITPSTSCIDTTSSSNFVTWNQTIYKLFTNMYAFS